MTYPEAEDAMLRGSVVYRDAWPNTDTMSFIAGAFERRSGLGLSAEDLDATDWRVAA